jgi:hypothetical protein
MREYLIKEKGMSPEAAKKYIERQIKAGKTLKDIAMAFMGNANA